MVDTSTMKKSTKIWLGIGSIWPLIYIPIFIATIFGLILTGPGGEPGMAFGAMFFFIFIVHMLTILLSLGLMIFFIIHVIKNEALKSDMKAMWIILFFFAGIIVEPIYWYLQIWKEPEAFPRAELNEPSAYVWDATDTRTREYQPPAEPPDWR